MTSPTGDRFLLAEFERNPPIQALAQPMARLAGLRLNARTHGPHNPPRLKALALQDVEGWFGPAHRPARRCDAGPAPLVAGRPALRADRRQRPGHRAVGRRGRHRESPPRSGPELNAVLGQPLDWMPDGTLLAKAVPASQGPAPKAPEVPVGPRIQETEGKAAPAPTYQDLLQNAFDETLFEFLGQSQLVRVDLATGALKPIGRPGLYADIQPSPDGKLILVARLQRPFSYLVPAFQFPVRDEVWDRAGKLVHTAADLPLAEGIPIEGVRTGPRPCTGGPRNPPPSPGSRPSTAAIPSRRPSSATAC